MHIFKYQVPVNDQDHSFHFGIEAVVLHVDIQNHADVVNIWVLHNDEESLRAMRTFRVFGTGQEIPDKYTYVGTALCQTVENPSWGIIRAPLVWHLFERSA